LSEAIVVAATDKLEALIKRINIDFDDWHNFYEHTKAVWRTFQQWVAEGHRLAAENTATGLKYTEQDLVALSQYYMTENLAPFALQRFSSTFEVFFFDFLRILMFTNPGSLGNKPLTLGQVIKAGAVDPLVSEAIDEKLHKIGYEKPEDWFEFAESVMKLGCPSTDEIEKVAEIKRKEKGSGVFSVDVVGGN
jgi:hypothetical protein